MVKSENDCMYNFKMHAKVYKTLAHVFYPLVHLYLPLFMEKVQCIYIKWLHFSLTVMAEAGEVIGDRKSRSLSPPSPKEVCQGAKVMT